jgi:putative tryptophan/tyrosine transport system substrate-binding protein
MKRREFIAGLGGAVALPLTARAQQTAKPVIGFLSTSAAGNRLAAAFQQGLGEQGYIDEQNVEVLFRLAPYDRLPALAEELVRRPVSVIVASGGHRLGRKVSHDEDSNRVFEWSRPGQAWPS